MYFSAPEHSPAFEHCSDTVTRDTAGIALLLAPDMHIQKKPTSKPISSPRIDFQVLDSDADVLSCFFSLAPNPIFSQESGKREVSG